MNQLTRRRGRNRALGQLVTCAMVALLIALMNTSSARAKLPSNVDVFPNYRFDNAPASVKLADLPVIRDEYNVLLRGKKKGTSITLTGVPLLDLLKFAEADTENVQFVKVRYGTTDDSVISLIPLDQFSLRRPPMILGSGRRPGLGPFPTPAVIPGQPDFSKPIREERFTPFRADAAPLALIPGKPGAKILSVKVRAVKLKSGEYMLSASATTGTSGAAKAYNWFGPDSNGRPVRVSNRDSIKTRDANLGNAVHSISVVIYELGTGSTGVGHFVYQSRAKRR